MQAHMAFGGSALIRAAEKRSDAQGLAELAKTARVLPLWRGKPLLLQNGGLGFVSAESLVLAQGSDLIFIGLDPDAMPEQAAIFACDISDWSPEAGAPAVASGFLDVSVQNHPALPPELGFGDLRNTMLDLSPLEGEVAATAKALVHWHRSHRFCAACGAESRASMAGWQRTCPSCAAQHFPRTDPVVIMLVTDGHRLLLGRSPGWPEGMFSCLAGFMEPGETVEAAVRREVLEETGVHVGAVRVLSSQPWPFPASLMLGCLGQATSTQITIDPVEIEQALWLDREELVQVLDGRHPQVNAPRQGTIARSLIDNWLADQLE